MAKYTRFNCAVCKQGTTRHIHANDKQLCIQCAIAWSMWYSANAKPMADYFYAKWSAEERRRLAEGGEPVSIIPTFDDPPPPATETKRRGWLMMPVDPSLLLRAEE